MMQGGINDTLGNLADPSRFVAGNLEPYHYEGVQ
jgi:hypothetical protein